MEPPSPHFWERVEALFAEAMDVSPPARAAFVAGRCDGDARLRDEVAALLDAEARAEGFLAVSAVAPAAGEAAARDDVGTVIGPFRLAAKIGEGGMGVVYRAERIDGDFEQQVAVKLIDAPMRHGDASRRFAVERQILAALHHPHIVTLLDGGVAADGRGYLVMEHVEGVPITTFCAEHRLPLADRLRLFQDLCAAVQDAHQHAVVHRDLKPANILITPDGVVKVLDFGIAKLLDAPDDEARTRGLAPLTPNYASPEQLRGLPVTTASDIYGLGVLLYEIVAGVRPYETAERPLEEIFDAVVTREPRRPSGVDEASRAALPYDRRSLKGDLDAIVLMAMDKDPARRYASAHELSVDIGRHLGGLPVLAREPSFGYLARSFARRHRTGVAAAGVSLAALVAALSVSLWQTRIAIAERNRATAHFTEVRQLANALIFRIHDQVQPLPGSTPVRQTIVAEALKYFEPLSADPDANDDLRLELAKAYHRIGRVQGDPSVANLGDREGALKSLDRAAALLRPIAARPDAPVEAVKQLAWTCNALATVAGLSDAGRAITAAREAVSVSERLVSRDPRSFEVRKVAAAALFSMATHVTEEESLPYWERTGRIFESLLAEQPGDPNNQRNVALVERYLGNHFGLKHGDARALAHFERARAMDERRLQAYPSDHAVQVDVASDYSLIAFQHKAAGRLAEAAAGYERALAMREQFVAADPNDMQSRRGLGYTLIQLSFTYEHAGEHAKSLQCAQRAIAIFEPIARRAQLYRVDLFEAERARGRSRIHTAPRAAACADFERATKIANEIESDAARLQQALNVRFQSMKADHAEDLARWCGAAPPGQAKAP